LIFGFNGHMRPQGHFFSNKPMRAMDSRCDFTSYIQKSIPMLFF
jgi:hypothetical protein